MPISPQQPLRTRFSTILLAMRQRLITKRVLYPEDAQGHRIFIVSRGQRNLPPVHGPNDILLRPRGFTVHEGMVTAGGRYTTMLTRVVDVIVRSRRELDKAGNDTQWLTDIDQGYFDLEENALDAFQVDSDLTDSEGNMLVCEPIRIVDGFTPEKDPTRFKPGWGDGNFGVEIKYLPPIDVSEQ